MATLTPLQFAEKYRNLQQYLYPLEKTVNGSSKPGGNVAREGWQTLKIATYRLGHSTWPDKFWPDIKPFFTKPVTVKIKTIADLPLEVTLLEGKAHECFRLPFGGKASPEQVQVCIQLIYRFHK